MEGFRHRRDLEYGYPSVERNIDFGLETQLTYLQILQYSGPDGPVFHHTKGDLDDSSFVSWIHRDVAKSVPSNGNSDSGGLTFVGGLRLLLGHCQYNCETSIRLLPLTGDKFHLVSQYLKLPEQFLLAMKARTSCAFKISCLSSASSVFDPTTCFVFKFGVFQPSYYHMAVSYDPQTQLSCALLLAKTQDHAFTALISSLEQHKDLTIRPLVLPILVTDISISSSAQRIQSADHRLNELEEKTGQHEWINRPMMDPLEMDFNSMTRQLNSIGRVLAVETMRVKSVSLALQKLTLWNEDLLHLRDDRPDNGGIRAIQRSENHTWVKETAAYHSDTCQQLALRAEVEEKRVQSQTAAVYQFMAQKDSKVNIQLAETTTIISKESKKDSSAMKAIAVLTMCFLPATFLAALFAMPFFNWDGGDLPIVKDGFKYYWAIAIPLTLLVLLIWAASMLLPWRRWLSEIRSRYEKDDVEAADGVGKKDE